MFLLVSTSFFVALLTIVARFVDSGALLVSRQEVVQEDDMAEQSDSPFRRRGVVWLRYDGRLGFFNPLGF